MKTKSELMKAMVDSSGLSKWAIYKRIEQLQKEHQLTFKEAKWVCAKQMGVNLSKKLEDEEIIEARKVISSFTQPRNSNVVVNNGGIISNSPIHQNGHTSKIRRNTGGVKQNTKTAGSKKKESMLGKILSLAVTVGKLIFLIMPKH